MQAGGIIDGLPLWALYIITIAIVLISAEAGWRLGNRRRQRPDHEEDAPVGAVVGATIGLLAFLLAFTFGMAASRYDTRKQLRPGGIQRDRDHLSAGGFSAGAAAQRHPQPAA